MAAERAASARAASIVSAQTASQIVSIVTVLADPADRFTDLGPGYYQARLDTDRKLRNHIRLIQALGVDVTIPRGRLTFIPP